VRIVSPATVVDLGEVMNGAGIGNGTAFALARWQIENGRSWVARDDAGTAIAMAGLIAVEGGSEGWFLAAPMPRPSLLAIARHIRLTLKTAGYGPIRVVLTTAEGARLARLVGLTGDSKANVLPRRRQQCGEPAARAVTAAGEGGAAPPAGIAGAAAGDH
jgi:hypothetical protein